MAEKKIYKCSVCKQPGHNKQNCPTAKLMKDHQVEQYIGILEALPLKETILSLLFIYAWKEAYGKEFKATDIILGITYGFTIPDALRGGALANTYALGALAVLGIGFVPDEIVDFLTPDAIDEMIGQARGTRDVPRRAVAGRKPFQGP